MINKAFGRLLSLAVFTLSWFNSPGYESLICWYQRAEQINTTNKCSSVIHGPRLTFQIIYCRACSRPGLLVALRGKSVLIVLDGGEQANLKWGISKGAGLWGQLWLMSLWSFSGAYYKTTWFSFFSHFYCLIRPLPFSSHVSISIASSVHFLFPCFLPSLRFLSFSTYLASHYLSFL